MNKTRLLVLLLGCSALGGCSYLPSWAGGAKHESDKLEGERLSVLPVISELQPDPALQGVPMVLPAPVPNSDWPQHSGGFTAQTSNLALSGTLDRHISAEAGEGGDFHHSLIPSPVVGGGHVFAMDAAGTISAHDAANIGKVAWRSKGLSEEDEDDTIGGGLAYDQGVLYVVSGRGLVGAFDAETGAEKWRKSLHAPLRAAPKVGGGKLFVVTLDNQIFALNPADGETQWTQRGITEAAGLMSSVSPTVAGDEVIVPYSSGEVYALAIADGKEEWSEALSAGKNTQASALLSGIGGDPVVDESVVFSVSSGGTIVVQAVKTGQRSWERPIGSLNTPWLAGDSLFVLTSNNTLVSFLKFDGHIRWSTTLPSYEDPEQKKDPISWKGPVMVDGKLALVSNTGLLYLVAAETGEIVAKKEVPEGIFTAPVVAGGQLFLMDKGATLYQSN